MSAPEGLKAFTTRYPSVKVVGYLFSEFAIVGDTFQITGWIDEGLNERAYIVPGLGDFGERRCAHAWYGHWGYAKAFSGIVHNISLGRPFRISHLSWCYSGL